MKSPFICILLFAILAYSSCNKKNDQKSQEGSASEQLDEQDIPQNVILLIGDGMGLTQISAAMLANGNNLNLERFPVIGLIKTQSSDDIITDSAAGATAFSTGKKTYNGAIGVDRDSTAVETILESAAKKGYATGLVATSTITHATPASFFAHQPSRKMNEEIAMDMSTSPVDFFIGGGKQYFEERDDNLNLLDSLRSKGFEIYNGLDAIPSTSEGKVAGFLGKDEIKSKILGRKDILPESSKKALEYLSGNSNFFLMIEGSQIDWQGHQNNSDGVIAEMIDFDKAIGLVLDFAEKDGNTLVIVTADHETGGYSIIGKDTEGNIVGTFNTTHHTGTLIPVFAYGPGAEKFSGIYENTKIFDLMSSFIKK